MALVSKDSIPTVLPSAWHHMPTFEVHHAQPLSPRRVRYIQATVWDARLWRWRER